MNEYLVQAVAREQLNDRIAAAEQGSRARRSTGRARRARRGGSGHGSTVVARTASPFSRAGLLIANDVRHPVGAFRSWLAAGQL